MQQSKCSPHSHSLKGLKGSPSEWMKRFARLFPENAKVLDLACGCGRNDKWLAKQGFDVTCVDWDDRCAQYISPIEGAKFLQMDIENGPWLLKPQTFDVVLVNFYLFRPVLSKLPELLVPGGYLIYETFMMPYAGFDGNRAKNEDFILKPLELVDVYRDSMEILAYEETLGEKGDCFQKILCRKPLDGKNLPVSLYNYETQPKI